MSKTLDVKSNSEKEKIAETYEKYIEDAFEVWDDLMNGFRFKNRFMHAEDDEPSKKSKEDFLNSRNPKKSTSVFQKTMRLNKPGFGTSATRIDIASKRVYSKMETPKPHKTGNLSEVARKRPAPKKCVKPHNVLMQSVLNKYVSKSIVITSETDSRRISQGDGATFIQNRPKGQ